MLRLGKYFSKELATGCVIHRSFGWDADRHRGPSLSVEKATEVIACWNRHSAEWEYWLDATSFGTGVTPCPVADCEGCAEVYDYRVHTSRWSGEERRPH